MLWLWRRLAAAALIQLLAWELPCAASEVLKSKKTHKKIKKKKDLMRKEGWGKEVGSHLDEALILARGPVLP